MAEFANKGGTNLGGNPNWVKGGRSPNPTGRPKGFGRKIREATGDGKELYEFALAVLRADIQELQPKGEVKLGDMDPRAMLSLLPDIKERLEALKWLRDNGWGRVPDAEHEDPIAQMSDEELMARVREELDKRDTMARVSQ